MAVKYLKAGVPFIGADGKQVLTKEFPDDETTVPGKVDTVLLFVLLQYRAQQGKYLEEPDLRRLNDAIKVLKAPPDDGYYLLDGDDWGVARKVVSWILPVLAGLERNTPVLLDAMKENCLDKKPEKAKVLQEAEETARSA